MQSESQFNQKVDDTLMMIEDILDDAASDLDVENSGGVLTVTCENGARVIFTRQTPVRQLWVATPSGGFHFDLAAGGRWCRDSDGHSLGDFLEETFAACAEETLTFDC